MPGGKDDYYVLCAADCRVAAGRRGTEIMRSQKIFSKSLRTDAGGVNSPVRAYRAVGMTPPPYIQDKRGHTSLMWKVISMWIMSAHGDRWFLVMPKEEVVKAVTAAVRGTSFGAPTNGGSRAGRDDSKPQSLPWK